MLTFVTGNTHKIASARLCLNNYQILFETESMPFIEIQSESIEEIAKQKAKDAFKLLQKPLIIKDDGWFIEGLNGFPGPFMKYMNEWLTTTDYINLLKDKPNRNVRFHEVLYYIDDKRTQLFSNDIYGEALDQPKGTALPFMELCTFRKDEKSMAECVNEGIIEFDQKRVWDDFAKWYKTTF